MQRKLPSNVLAHSAVPLVERQETHVVMTSSDLERSHLPPSSSRAIIIILILIIIIIIIVVFEPR